MEKSIITSGKTIDLAIESALSQLGLDRDSVSVTVLQQAKSGFLGFGAQSAKVQVSYEVPDPVPEKEEKPKSALGSASRSKPKPPAAPVKKPEAPQAPKAEAPKAEPPKPAQSAPAPAKRPEPPKQDRPRPPKPPRPEKPKAPAAPRTYAPAEPGSVEEKIEVFIKGLLEHMDSNAVPHCWKDEGNTYKVDLVGDDLGYLIGRRGETLDAIQQLTGYAVNHGQSKRVRIHVDAEGYRAKREESLVRLAQKVAGKVVKYRRNVTLEPMNAYERHVIHTALQETPDITTYSIGTEPNRRTVVAYSRGEHR